MKQNKIGIVIPSLKFGGNVTSAVNIANALKCWDVTIIVHEVIEQIPYDGKTISLDCPIHGSFIGKVITSIKRLIRLKSLCNSNHYDKMILILSISNPLNYFRYKSKKIVSCRDYGDLKRHRFLYAMMTRTSDSMVFNSKDQMTYFIQKYPRLARKCSTIYNIVDIKRIEQMKKEALEANIREFYKDSFVICAVGRLCNAKGFSNLIKSFYLLSKENSKVKLILIGDGELRPQIEEMIRVMGLENRVLLPGFRVNPIKYITNSKIFALSSLYEGFPNVMVEAMCCGTPVVASDCPTGPAEILGSRATDSYLVTKYGVLVKGFSEADSNWNTKDITDAHKNYADAINFLLNNETIAKSIQEQAILRVQSFSPEQISKEWIQLLS